MAGVSIEKPKAAQLRASLSRLPQVPMVRRPTPIDELPHLSAALGGPRILVKREDMSGLAFGGNKTRELDYFIGAAKAAGADVFVAGGGVAQSNHAAQCAAAARRAGMTPVLVLHNYRTDSVQGNYLLSRLLGADIRFVDTGDIDSAINQRVVLQDAMNAAAEEYEAKGHKAWVLHSSFHPLGAAAFVDCALEIEDQLAAAGERIDHLYVTSAGATQVGLLLGSKFLGAPYRIQAISYTTTAGDVIERMVGLGEQTAQLLDLPTRLFAADIASESFAGPGYGIPSGASVEAIHLLAETEGMFVDPIYTGKGLSGLIDHVRSGRIGSAETVLFLHTGGTPALFAYAKEVIG